MTGWSRSGSAGLVAAFLVGAASGCGSGGGDAPIEFEVRDSSGVTVAINSFDHASQEPAYVLEEVVRIGAVSGREEEEFGALMDIAIGDGGEIYGLDSGKRMVRVFSPSGEFVREFGGPGEGPGEFEHELLRISVALDTIVVQMRESTFVFGEEEVRELGAPDFLPVVGRLFVSPNGRVLVHRRDLSESVHDEEGSGIWDLLDPDGRIVGRVTIDENLRTYNLVLTDSRLYAIARDELEVQYIVGYDIVPDTVSDSGNWGPCLNTFAIGWE